MLYLNTNHLERLGTNWPQLIGVIKETLGNMAAGDFSQPVKPYLRYGDPKNRIIAMPAYVGGMTSLAGIKWIASFPDNIFKNKARANSVTILNQHDSGIPLCIIHSALVSTIRTAAVSGLLIGECLQKNIRPLTIGMTGFGPVGRMHLNMLTAVLGERIGNVLLYDPRPIDTTTVNNAIRERLVVCDHWEQTYETADIFITCTTSTTPYIDKPPKKGSLHLNVSLRDYVTGISPFMDIIIVDDWDEVCRQNTDIENMHRQCGLQKEDTLSLTDLVCGEGAGKLSPGQVIMFNPMGMAAFDIAIGGYYYREALSLKEGILLP